MTQTANRVLIAKRDIFAEIDNGSGHPVKQLVARAGQEVPPVLAEHVDDEDVTSEVLKTRRLIGRTTAERAAVAAETEEPGISEPADAVVESVSTGDEGLVAENEQLRERLAEAERTNEAEAESRKAELEAAEEKLADAEKRAEEAEASATAAEEAKSETKEEPVKDGKSDEKADKAEGSKARSPSSNKARSSAKNKARSGAKAK